MGKSVQATSHFGQLSLLDKTLDFHFLLLLLCLLIFCNTVLAIFTEKSILTITPTFLREEVSLGQFVVIFAAFSLVLFFYALHPRTDEHRVYVSDDILTLIQSKRKF